MQVPCRSTTTIPFSAASGTSRKASVASVRNKKADIKPLPKAPMPSRLNSFAKPPSPLTQRETLNQTSKQMPSLNHTHTVKGINPLLNILSRCELFTGSSMYILFICQFYYLCYTLYHYTISLHYIFIYTKDKYETVDQNFTS